MVNVRIQLSPYLYFFCIKIFRFILIKNIFFLQFQDIDYEGFRRFLDAFLDCETPEELSKHLFVSFVKPSVAQSQIQGKALNQMAAISSNAACAAVTSHTKGSIPNLNSIVENPPIVSSEPRQSFVDKIHGITDKLQSLGHLGHESESKSKSGKIFIIFCFDRIKFLRHLKIFKLTFLIKSDLL